MANDENLIPFNRRTESEQREIAKKGGKASGESRRRNADIRKIAERILFKKHKDKHSDKNYSGNEAIVMSLLSAAVDPKSRNMLGSIDRLLMLTGQDKSDEDREKILNNLEIQKKEIELLQKKIDNADW